MWGQTGRNPVPSRIEPKDKSGERPVCPRHSVEPVIRRIIAACGLAWHDACLRPECNPRAVRTPSKWQTRQPIYRTSVARWRRYEPWLGPLRALVDDGSQPGAGIARS